MTTHSATMNMTVQKSSLQVTSALRTACIALEAAITSSASVKDSAGLPSAFSIVTKHLPTLHQALDYLKRRLEDIPDSQRFADKHMDIYRLSKTSQDQSEYLQDFFAAVTTTDGSRGLDKYRDIVKKNNDKKIEDVLKNLLSQTIDIVSAEPLKDEALIRELEKALNEITSLAPSLPENAKRGPMLNNHGNGNQFYHGGSGNQNHCSGGVQVTGNGPTTFGGGIPQ